MNDAPEILLLAHRIPYPPDKGDKIRSWRLLRHLADHYRVHLAAFVDDERDFAHADFLSGLCESCALIPLDPVRARFRSLSGFLSGEPLSFAYYRDRAMSEAVDEMRRRPLSFEIAFSSTMAPYIATPVGERPRIVDLCDADSEKWRQYAPTSGFPMSLVYGREGEKLAAAETAIVNWADHSFAISEAEAAIFNERADAARDVDWWINGVDSSYFNPQGEFVGDAEPADVVFVGAMDYRANIDAVLFFVREVWPLVRKEKPDASFVIVGANPTPEIQRLDGEAGVRVKGRVDDVRPWIAASTLSVAPLRIARGVQNKVLEAMAMEKPIVATTDAATGISCTNGEDLFIADEPGEFARAVLALLDAPARRKEIGAAARQRILKDYDWGQVMKRLDAALPSRAPGQSSPSRSSKSLNA